MKVYKLRLTDLKNLEKLYKKVGAISKDGRQAFVDCVYISPKAEKYLQKATKDAYKKEYPYLKKKSLDASVGMYLLNLAPRCLEGLPDNIILVDDVRIEEGSKPLDDKL